MNSGVRIPSLLSQMGCGAGDFTKGRRLEPTLAGTFVFVGVADRLQHVRLERRGACVPEEEAAIPRLTSVGAWRRPRRPEIPTATVRLSENAASGRWQVAQESEPSRESRRSKNSCRPSVTASAVSRLSSGTGM